MRVWMPTLTRKVTALYFGVSLDLSSTTRTLTPRLWASFNALAIGAEAKAVGLEQDLLLSHVHFTDHGVRSSAAMGRGEVVCEGNPGKEDGQPDAEGQGGAVSMGHRGPPRNIGLWAYAGGRAESHAAQCDYAGHAQVFHPP